jgi:hypothetical protein
MQWNKTKAGLLIALGLVGGTAGAIGMQVKAQQATQPGQSAQIQTSQTTPAQPASAQVVDSKDTDNIQDPGGVEKPDVVGQGTETNDDKNEVNDNEQNEGPENSADDVQTQAK